MSFSRLDSGQIARGTQDLLHPLIAYVERWLPSLGVSPAQLGTSGTLSVFVAPGAALVYLLRSRLFRDGGRPPIVAHWIPWLGSAPQIQKDPDSLFRKARRELGPIFGVRVFGTTLYHVVDADLIMEIYKRPDVFGASPVQATFLNQTFDLSMQALASSGAVGEMIQQLSPPHFHPLLFDFVTHARSQIDKLPSNTPLSLLSIAIQPMRNAECATLFGPSFLASHYDHEIVTAFKTFSSNIPLLAANFPAFLMPTTVAARQTLLNTLDTYFDIGLPDDVSLLLKELAALAQSQGWATHDLAAYVLGLMWPLLSNAPYVVYWLLVFHLHRPEGLVPLVREVNWVLASGRDLSEVVRDSSATPYLDACIDETIRLASDPHSMRWVTKGEECELGGYTFKSGDQVACNTRGVHMDAEVYAQPKTFEPERFMDGGKEKVNGRFIPFGGGFSACSGSHLALAQIKTFMIVLLSEFDISLEDERQTLPGFSPGNRGFGMIRPVGDNPVMMDDSPSDCARTSAQHPRNTSAIQPIGTNNEERIPNLDGRTLHVRLASLKAELENGVPALDDYSELLHAIEHCQPRVDNPGQVAPSTSNADSEMVETLRDIARLFWDRFENSQELAHLNLTIQFEAQVLQWTPDNDLGRAEWLSKLGASYQYRYNRLGESRDIDRALAYNEQAVLSTPISHPGKPRRLNNLGNSYLTLFERRGRLGDLDNSIVHYEQAISLTPEDHHDKHAWLSNLGNSYLRLFERLGRLEDLEKSISCQEQAVQLTPDEDVDKPATLNNLGNSYLTMFERLGKLADIKKSIDYRELAVNLLPNGHPDRPSLLNNLGSSYRLLCRRVCTLQDIEKGHSYQKQAVALTPNGHPDKPAQLSNLSLSYQLLFDRQGRLGDLDESIRCQELGLSLVSDDYPDKSVLLNNLGNSYFRKFQHSKLPEHALVAIDIYKRASHMPTGRPSTRLRTSQKWARLSLALRLPQIDAYTSAMTILPQVVWIGSSARRRYECLATDIQGLVIEAASAAISAKRYDLAVEWLEQGRSVVWNQMLQLRTPLDSLSTADPDLAAQLRQVAHNLEQLSLPRETATTRLLNTPSLDETARQHRRLAEHWDQLLDKARKLPGFRNFLRPTPFVHLTPAARSSALVVIVMDSSWCNAIALLPVSATTVRIPLPSLSYEKATILQAQLLSSLNGEHFRTRSARRPFYHTEGAPQGLEDVLASLWTDVARPVLEELEYLELHPGGAELPRVTWCTTGPLSFLPLHAAGLYDEPHVRAFDYVISSYTPTLGALLKPEPTPATRSFQGILAVGQAEATGSPSLPGTVQELDKISANASQMPFTRLEGGCATKSAVLNAMEKHSWAHLACHASQQPSDPTASAFQLHDGYLSLATIIEKPLEHAEFAFLSACQTATGDEKLPDEAVHLAAGMLMVGYSSIVATMWSIQDQDAPLVAGQVYGYMLEDGVPDSRKAAWALHKATASLRDVIGQNEFSRWVPYIHLGC
ncbi:hypothetical protein FRC06_011533 [Ceratobasidium sp. 370]|nr:hypothetical protein FRC06_011533 [Ceratobasidium sp. 370]